MMIAVPFLSHAIKQSHHDNQSKSQGPEMNSKQLTKSRTISTNFITTALLAVLFIAGFTGQADAQISATSHESSGWVPFVDAVPQSASSGKPIMLVFSGSDWCSYCQRLEQEVFQTPDFESWSANNVIKVMVDFPQHHQLAADIATQNQNLKSYFGHELRGYPTVLMIQADGTVIGKTGYVAGGPMAWIMKANAIIGQSPHFLADSSMPKH